MQSATIQFFGLFAGRTRIVRPTSSLVRVLFQCRRHGEIASIRLFMVYFIVGI